MAGVFISYRREDSPGHAGRIFDRVRARFGADVVFMDVTAIDAGVDFVDAIDSAVGTCDVLLAVIGPQWTSAVDRDGHRRLDSATDFVRLEIGGALKRNVRVVPVLVDGARLPTAGDLPEELQPLLRRNAVELRDARWDADIEQLIASLERIVTRSDGPLRIESPPRGRLRWVAAIAVLALSATAAAVYGPRACASPPPRSVATTAPAAAAPSPSAAAPVASSPSPAPPPSPRPNPPVPGPVPIPDVVGRQLSDAREILRRAGVDVARVLYRDDRTKAADLVVVQSDARASSGSPRAVVLTAVARAAVVIHHRPDDADMARRLAGALTAAEATSGLAVQTLEMTALRPEGIARVSYSDGALADTAGAIAKDASAWLAQNDSGRPALSAALQRSVVARTIVIGLPGPGSTDSPSTALPDVRGMTLGAARRTLSAAGVTNVQYKWSADGSRTALEVFDQSEVTGGSGGRTVVLQVGAKGTLFLYYLAADAPIVERFTRALQGNMNLYGILVRPIRLTAPRPTLVGKVASADAMLSREARTIATFTTNWFAKEAGRQLGIETVSNAGGDPRQITFGLPSLQ